MANYVSLDNLRLYDTKIKSVIANGDATAEAKAATVQTNLETEIARAKAAEEANAAAAKTADDKAVAAQGEVDALEALVGTLPEGATTVVGYVDAKTANIASSDTVSALSEKMTQAEADIDAIEADYLKGVDKTELAEDIAEVATAVETEKTRAEGVEGGLDTRIKAVEDDYLKAADKTELEGKITTVSNAVEVLTEGVDAEKVDGVKDLIKYVEDHGAEVTGMKEDIEANADEIAALKAIDNATQAEMDAAIATVNGEIAKKADQTTVDGIEDRVEALEGVDVATKAYVDQAETDAIASAKEYSDGLNTAMTTKVDGIGGRVGTLETTITGKADKATTLAGYGIGDAYTKTETDTAISNAVAAIQPISDDEINALFTTTA
jgi:hypothetical protein